MYRFKLTVILVVILCGLVACSPVEETPTEQAKATLPGAAQPSAAPAVSAFPALDLHAQYGTDYTEVYEWQTAP
jgi:hypothetical protein